METKPYPLFVPPDAVVAKSHREWSKKEAQIYFDWLTGCLDQRVTNLLDFFGVSDSATSSARDLLVCVGEHVAQTLEDPKYSEVALDGTRVLTNMGYALAADMGLLTAKLLRDALSDTIQWEILRKPKSDVSYNLPILSGFGWDTYDPVGVSIADAVAVLASRREPDVWAKVFDACIADAQA